MGDVQFKSKSGTWKDLTDFAEHIQVIQVADMEVPILSLEYEYTSYLKLQRHSKADLIK